jgi:hypothetical protein
MRIAIFNIRHVKYEQGDTVQFDTSRTHERADRCTGISLYVHELAHFAFFESSPLS